MVGVSGGCDSSYMLYKRELGLRPLAVHFDNTWDRRSRSKTSQRPRELDVDLYTLVVNNREYDDIYRSFLKAGTPDIEAPTDIGLAVTLNLACEKYGVRYIFEGHSFRTEGISPLGWIYMDGKYIQSVQTQYGTLPLKTFPNMSFFVPPVDGAAGIGKHRPLYYMDYVKTDAMGSSPARWGGSGTAATTSRIVSRRSGIPTSCPCGMGSIPVCWATLRWSGPGR